VLKDVRLPVVGILDQGNEPFASELGSLGGLPIVLQVEQTSYDLLFASFFHAISFWINWKMRHGRRVPVL
jgi:hypothetical protein